MYSPAPRVFLEVAAFVRNRTFLRYILVRLRVRARRISLREEPVTHLFVQYGCEVAPKWLYLIHRPRVSPKPGRVGVCSAILVYRLRIRFIARACTNGFPRILLYAGAPVISQSYRSVSSPTPPFWQQRLSWPSMPCRRCRSRKWIRYIGPPISPRTKALFHGRYICAVNIALPDFGQRKKNQPPQ